MSEPIIAQKSPYVLKMKPGSFYWCTCGKSKKQPMCDGSHTGTSFKPLAWTAPATEQKYFCACKQTAGVPFCDGKHQKLPADAEGKKYPANFVTDSSGVCCVCCACVCVSE